MSIRVILTGATGMVGEGVLHECLHHDDITEIAVIGRRACGVIHPKLKEIIHADFYNLLPLEEQLKGYDACFFCLGTSSLGKKEAEYYMMTYTLTLHIANLLSRLNTGMIFCYVSGAGTDGSEKGRMMWARVKGKTENDLMKLPFRKVYNFRPGVLQPTPGLSNTLVYYHYLGWLIPLIRFFFPQYVASLRELGLAMIRAATRGYAKPVLEVRDIVLLAK